MIAYVIYLLILHLWKMKPIVQHLACCFVVSVSVLVLGFTSDSKFLITTVQAIRFSVRRMLGVKHRSPKFHMYKGQVSTTL